jgi:hypothetical protein
MEGAVPSRAVPVVEQSRRQTTDVETCLAGGIYPTFELAQSVDLAIFVDVYRRLHAPGKFLKCKNILKYGEVAFITTLDGKEALPASKCILGALMIQR